MGWLRANCNEVNQGSVGAAQGWRAWCGADQGCIGPNPGAQSPIWPSDWPCSTYLGCGAKRLSNTALDHYLNIPLNRKPGGSMVCWRRNLALVTFYLSFIFIGANDEVRGRWRLGNVAGWRFVKINSGSPPNFCYALLAKVNRDWNSWYWQGDGLFVWWL